MKRLIEPLKTIKDKIGDICKIMNRRNTLLLVSQKGGWYTGEFCTGVKDAIKRDCAIVLNVDKKLCRDKVIYFVNRFPGLDIDRAKSLSEKNRLVLIWWHGGAYPVEQNREHSNMSEWLEKLSMVSRYISKIQITSSLYYDVLQRRNIPKDKIVYLPAGIRISRFRYEHDKSYWRKKIGIPNGKFCIASFQRDGKKLPKLTKGPDVLVEAISKIYSRRDDVFVLLAGPDRGYVRERLSKLGVPYKFLGLVPPGRIAGCYFASDVYMVCSREEGGPAAVLEAMASGVPLVSTKVGMAVDIIENGKSGFLVDIEDAEGLADSVLKIIGDKRLASDITARGREIVKKYDWKVLAPKYNGLLYLR